MRIRMDMFNDLTILVEVVDVHLGPVFMTTEVGIDVLMFKRILDCVVRALVICWSFQVRSLLRQLGCFFGNFIGLQLSLLFRDSTLTVAKISINSFVLRHRSFSRRSRFCRNAFLIPFTGWRGRGNWGWCHSGRTFLVVNCGVCHWSGERCQLSHDKGFRGRDRGCTLRKFRGIRYNLADGLGDLC
eukprot:Protomagalhaensia_sp_Gyna_25__5231@NODE_636_length_2949_cov_715_214089_g495_i0_p3_GENE_NODE_636_length_2949_cov_715_214089_g495_i0NODE_636_length_2949_cov_715_214089_g495_i0_p3_ORF_typecomplete_len186_score3_13DUF3668/PF12416_8/0_063_NODE_636_length_2949_cov_715_214089_g495_i020122569